MAVWDWESIKNEYATGNMSYRDLSNKYGMAYSLICNRGSKDKWAEAREQYRSKKRVKTMEKMSSKEAARAAKVFSVADKLLGKIDRMASSDTSLTSKDIRALTAAVRDLKEIHGVKTALEREEQQARIDALRRQNEKENTGKEPVTVVMGEELEEYCV